MLDLHGATWGPRTDQYVMDATALRYEQYEICFAAKVQLQNRYLSPYQRLPQCYPYHHGEKGEGKAACLLRPRLVCF